MTQDGSRISTWLATASPPKFSAYCITAAFTTYFCMYAFRKPFTAATFEGMVLVGVGYKTILIAAQVTGYTISKFIGIKVISEMPPSRRAVSIVALIAAAEGALLLFAVVPAPLNVVFLFVNGLPLGMVFGLVLSYLEGRRLTEALSAGLCASFIVSSGVVKTVGRTLILDWRVSEYWMPFLTGLLFVAPLLIGVWLLSQIPPPTAADIDHRTERIPMDATARRTFFRRHLLGLVGLLMIYVLLTITRSIRDDFGVEIWRELLGYESPPSIFTWSEMAVMLGVMALSGAAIWIRSNRAAFLTALSIVFGGFVLVLVAVWGQKFGVLGPFTFMVLIGLGTYVPYVVFHTTIFERLIAAFRERGTMGYLMYLADAVGYLGYVVVMVARQVLPGDINFLTTFLSCSALIASVALVITAALMLYFARQIPQGDVAEATMAPISSRVN